MNHSTHGNEISKVNVLSLPRCPKEARGNLLLINMGIMQHSISILLAWCGPTCSSLSYLSWEKTTRGNRNLQKNPTLLLQAQHTQGYQVCTYQGNKKSLFRVVSPRTGFPALRMWQHMVTVQSQLGGSAPHAQLLSPLLQVQGLQYSYGYSPSNAVLNPRRVIALREGNTERLIFHTSWISPPASVFPMMLFCNVILHRLVVNYSATARFCGYSEMSSFHQLNVQGTSGLLVIKSYVPAWLDIFTLSKRILYSHITENFHCYITYNTPVLSYLSLLLPI